MSSTQVERNNSIVNSRFYGERAKRYQSILLLGKPT